MIMFSDERLKLEARWFTGEEWAKGIAEEELRREYLEAVARETAIEHAKPKAQREQERRDKKFQKWFEWSMKVKNEDLEDL